MIEDTSTAVIIPAYNCEQYIVEALRSLEQQTVLPDEVIVVDDGSCDRTADLVHSFNKTSELNILLIRQSNRGIAAARNAGVRRSKGRFIALLDGDDYFLPDFLKKATAALIAHPEFILCFSDRRVINQDGGLLRLDLDDPKFRAMPTHRFADGTSALAVSPFIALVPGNIIPIGNLMLRRETFLQVGGFDEDLLAVEDRPFLMILAKLGTFGFIDEPLGVWRRHSTNTSGPSNAFKMNWYEDIGLQKIQERAEVLMLSPAESEAIKRERGLLPERLLYSASASANASYPQIALNLYRQGRVPLKSLVKSSLRFLWRYFVRGKLMSQRLLGADVSPP